MVKVCVAPVKHGAPYGQSLLFVCCASKCALIGVTLLNVVSLSCTGDYRLQAWGALSLSQLFMCK